MLDVARDLIKPDIGSPGGPGSRPVGPVQVRALFEAIEQRLGHQEASDIWLAVFGAYDAAET